MLYYIQNYVIDKWTKNSEPEIANDHTLLNREMKWTGLNLVRLITSPNSNYFKILKKLISSIDIVCFYSKSLKNSENSGKLKQMCYSILISITKIFLWTYLIYGFNSILLSTLSTKTLWPSRLLPYSTTTSSRNSLPEWKDYTQKMQWKILTSPN